MKRYSILLAIMLHASCMQAQQVEAIFIPTVCSIATDQVQAVLPIMPIVKNDEVKTDYSVFNKEESVSTGIHSIDMGEMNNDKQTDTWYSLDGRKLGNKPTTKGFYIVNGKKVTVK